VSEIREKLKANPIPVQIPIGSEDAFKGVIDLMENKAVVWHDDETMGVKYSLEEIPAELADEAAEWRNKLVEAVAEKNDELLERYFENPNSITSDEMAAVIREATIDGTIVPVMCGSAYKNKGVQRLLDAIVSYLPSPLDIGAVKGIHPHTHKVITREPDVNAPLSALAFKIITDPYVGRLVYLRVYSGKLVPGKTVLNPRTGKKDRINRLYQMHANKQNPRDVIEAGDICGAVGLKDIRTGDTITDISRPISLESMTFPEPVIGVAIEPKTQADIDKLGTALNKLSEEDPTFQIKTNEDSGQTIISGMGELHLEILIDRLKREFKVECNQGQPQVAYKEALTTTVEHREVFKKQTGGHGKFADILVEIGPADEGVTGLEFVDQVKGGNIPKEYMPAIEKGFKLAMQSGPLAGFPLDSLKVVVKDGSYHPVDSDSLSFQMAADRAFRNAAPKGNPILLEPIMSAEVVTPEEYMGDVITDFNKRRGRIDGMESKAGARVIKAKVPLAENFGYVTVLRNITSGRATSSMEFSHYEPVPPDIARKVVENAKGIIKIV